jgi:hypothetical protein
MRTSSIALAPCASKSGLHFLPIKHGSSAIKKKLIRSGTAFVLPTFGYDHSVANSNYLPGDWRGFQNGRRLKNYPYLSILK